MAEPEERAAIIARGVEQALERLSQSLSAVRSMLISAETRRIRLLDPVRIQYGKISSRMVRDLRAGLFAETNDIMRAA